MESASPRLDTKYIAIERDRDPWSEQVGFLLVEHVSGQPRRVAKSLEFVELPDGHRWIRPFAFRGWRPRS